MDLQKSWMTSVSQYLLTRRQQIQSVYSPSQQMVAHHTDELTGLLLHYQNTVFEVLLSVLGNELEQGHTVIHLTQSLPTLTHYAGQAVDSQSKHLDNHKVHTKYRQRQQLTLNFDADIVEIDDIHGTEEVRSVSQINNRLDADVLNHAGSAHTTEGVLAWQLTILNKLLDGWDDILQLPIQQSDGMLQALHTQNIESFVYQQLIPHDVDKATQQHLYYHCKLASEFYQFCLRLNQFTKQQSTYAISSNDDSKNYAKNALANFGFYLQQLPLCVEDKRLLTVSASASVSTSPRQTVTDKHAPIVFSFNQSMTKTDNTTTNQLTLWLHRTWQAEQSIIQHIQRLNQAQLPQFDISVIDSSKLNTQQLSAVEVAHRFAFSIITGGPGTGKTYTVAQLVIAIHQFNMTVQKNMDTSQPKQTYKPLNLVLTAPTGKAAQRMQESLTEALKQSYIDIELQEAKTLHRLLGIGRTGIPRYTKDNRLSEDVIIVDEASMLGVELANHLFSAVKAGARLILLGDAHQLSAVEAGAVLFDLCQLEYLKPIHVNLTESRRFTDDSAIGQFAKLINQQNISQLPDIQLSSLGQQINGLMNQFDDIVNYEVDEKQAYQQLAKNYHAYFEASLHYKQQYTNGALTDDAISALNKLMDVFGLFRILTSGHHGVYGDDKINQVMMQQHRALLKQPLSMLEWYHGRPVMVQKNNYALGLFNGDIGICVESVDGLYVYFEGKNKPIHINKLGNLEVKTAYAMTVHKSQGSEFRHVAVMFTETTDNVQKNYQHPLINREMLYTAVTRAKQSVSLYAKMETIQAAIMNPTIRRTGLTLCVVS